MKKYILFFLCLFLIFFVILISYSPKQRFSDLNQYLIYDSFSEKWIVSKKKEYIPTEVKQENNNADGFHNESVLRGFFDHYDKQSDMLYIKTVVPFTKDDLYQVKAFRVGIQQSFYCTAAHIVNEQTGQSTPTWFFRFPVYDGDTLYTYHEKNISLEQFFTTAKADTWLFLQLTSPYSETKDNYIYKLVAVGLCE